FYPSELGMLVSDLLVKNFRDIFDVAYTAHMEEELDEVEDGKLAWTDALGEFYKKFKKDLRVAEREMDDIKGEGIATDVKCEKCANRLVIKHGRYGQFTACSNYPECKYVKRETLGIPCPEKDCTGELVVRRTKRGKTFYGCSRYPDCKFTAWDKPVAEA